MILHRSVSSAIASLALAPTLVEVSSAQTPRAWTPADSIALNYFSQAELPGYPMPSPDRAVALSSDGRYAMAVTSRGDLENDRSVTRVHFWDTARVRRALAEGRPFSAEARTFSRMSANNDLPVTDLHFARDNASVLFISGDNHGVPNVFEFDISSGVVRQLTSFSEPVVSFAELPDGILLVNTRPALELPPIGYPTEFPERVTVQNFDDYRHEARPLTVLRTRRATALTRQHNALRSFAVVDRRVVALSEGIGLNTRSIGISPDRRHISGVNVSPTARTFVVIDVSTGSVRDISDAIRRGQSLSLWSPDGSNLLLLDIGAEGSRVRVWRAQEARMETVSAGAGVILNQRWTSDASFVLTEQPARSLSATAVAAARDVEYSNTGNQWRDQSWAVSASIPPPSANTAQSPSLQFELVQGANQPPVLYARDEGRSIALTQPDPLLAQVWWARSREVQWTEASGEVHRAGLLLPRNYSPGQRVPLVIQYYNYLPSLFLPDGNHPVGTSDAAQSLVSRGIAVLIMADDRMSQTPERAIVGDATALGAELPRGMAHIDGAIAELARQGIVDTNRIGMTGFSRGGLYVYYAITHPGRFPLAAAIADDSTTASYAESLLDIEANNEDYFNYHGTFWEAPDRWFAAETSFNVNRSRTPVLFAHHNKSEDLQSEYNAISLTTLGAFALNARPVDYVEFGDALHNMIRPRQRLALSTLVADWMDFWLNDHEDISPGKSEQYARWRDIRADWRRQQAWEAAGHPAGSPPAPDFQSTPAMAH